MAQWIGEESGKLGLNFHTRVHVVRPSGRRGGYLVEGGKEGGGGRGNRRRRWRRVEKKEEGGRGWKDREKN